MTHVEGGRRTFHQALTELAVPYAPAVDWGHKGSRTIVEELSEDLLRKLQFDFLYLLLKNRGDKRDVEVARFKGPLMGSSPTDAVIASIVRRLHGETTESPSVIPLRTGLGSLRVFAVPIGGDPASGVIAAGCRHERFPTEEDRLLLGVAANYVAIAARATEVPKTGLLETAERKRETRRQQDLAAIAIKINSSLSVAEPVQTILQAVSDAAADIIGAHMVTLAMTSQHNWAKVVQAVSLSNKYAAWRTYADRPTGAGIYSEVCRTNRPLRFTHAELLEHPLFRRFSGAAGRHPPLSGWLCVPLVGRDGRNLGALHASDKFTGDFTAEDEAVALQLASIAAAAMENCAKRTRCA